MKSMKKVVVGVAVALIGASAQAGFILDSSNVGPVPGVASPLAANNDLAAVLAEQGLVTTHYSIGARLATDAEGGTVTYQYLGNEAGYVNRFFADGGQLFSTGGRPDEVWDPIASSYQSYAASGSYVNFSFCTDGERSTGINAGCMTNANNSFWLPSGGLASQSIAISLLDPFTALLWWDDSGAGPDDNHDDMVVIARLSVPEPATSLLFGLGLLGMGLAARARKGTLRA